MENDEQSRPQKRRRLEDSEEAISPPKNVVSHGVKQLTKLRSIITANKVYRTQSQSYLSNRVTLEQLVAFLKSKLTEQRNASCRAESTFGYLQTHIVGTIPDQDVLSKLTLPLTRRYGSECRVSDHYLQCKIPTSEIPVSESDRKNNKAIGILQVQAYLVTALLQESNDNVQQFLAQIDTLLAMSEKLVASHLCKRKCLTPGHVLVTNHGINQQHDYCPAWWIVNGNLVSFCTCDKQNKCLAPGPQFDAASFRDSLSRAIGGFPDPSLQ